MHIKLKDLIRFSAAILLIALVAVVVVVVVVRVAAQKNSASLTPALLEGSFASNVSESSYNSRAGSSSGRAEDSAASTLESYFIKVAETVKPAVVNISTVHIEKITVPQYYEFFFGSPFDDMFEEFFGAPRSNNRRGSDRRGVQPQMRRLEGTGSGVIISADGYILTNEHVVRDADEIIVTMYVPPDGSQKKYKGKVVGKDSRTDLAIIKISGGKFPSARLGNSDAIKVGQWVIAIGSPFGLEQTVTTGIVSAKRQALSIEGRTYRDLIQTDAAINRGNSGGPLCNLEGEVIGINTAIYAPTGVFSGIGFAVPINRARLVIDELIKKGKVTRGWLGVEIRPIDIAIQKNFGLKTREGAFVANVIENSPAKKAGVKRGDVIVEFDSKKVTSPMELQDMVSATAPDKKVYLKVVREGSEIVLPITLSSMPDEITAGSADESGSSGRGGGGSQENKNATFKWEGMVVSGITDDLRSEFGLPADTKGVVVTDVDEYSRASSIGVVPGDVIKMINNKPVSDISDFKKIVSSVDFSKGVVFDIIRDGRPVYLTYSESDEE